MKIKFTGLLAMILMTGGCFHMPSANQTVDWKTYKFDDYRLSLESPFSFDRDLGESTGKKGIKKSMGKQTPMASYNSNQFFTITLTCLEADHKIEASPVQMADASVKGMEKMSLLMGDYKGQTQPTTCCGYDAASTAGTCKLYHLVATRFVMINVEDKNWLWQVNILYPDKNDDADQMAQRVMNSIKIAPEDSSGQKKD